MGRIQCADDGFTLTELMAVVVIIGILTALVIPLFVSTHAQAATRTCLANQRELEGAVGMWRAANPSRPMSDLAGLMDADHPLIIENFMSKPPSCPAAPVPADRSHPTVAEGAYTFDLTGTLADCAFGSLGAHGHY